MLGEMYRSDLHADNERMHGHNVTQTVQTVPDELCAVSKQHMSEPMRAIAM